MTAVLVLQLVRDGRLGARRPGLDGARRRRVRRPVAAHPARAQLGDAVRAGRVVVGALGRAVLRRAGRPPTTARARCSRRTSEFHYSNLGYALLGEVAARLLGCTWWEAVQQRILTPLGMSRTSYLPEGAAAQGQSVHPYDGTLVDEPATDTGAMAPAGQVWATITDLATLRVVPRSGPPGRAVGRGARPGVRPAVQHARGRREVRARAGLPALRRRLRHARRAHRLDARASWRPAGRPQAPDRRRGARQRDHRLLAGRDRDRAARRARALRADAARAVAARRPACRPSWPASPASGTGATRRSCSRWRAAGWSRGATASRRTRFEVRDGRVLGVTGYHAGEELKVVRRADGSDRPPRHRDVHLHADAVRPGRPHSGGHPGR